jgi:hypothetical protein
MTPAGQAQPLATKQGPCHGVVREKTVKLELMQAYFAYFIGNKL